MGLTAAGTEVVTGNGLGGISALTTNGNAVGGVFATVALAYVLGYLDVLDAVETEHARIRRMLVTASVPLAMVFVGIILTEIGKSL